MTSEVSETKPGDGDENKVIENDNETLEARKKKLKDEINELKDLMYQMQCNMKISQFKEIQKLNDLDDSFSIGSPIIQNMFNGEIDLQNDLYRYMGLYCTRFSESYTFKFITTSISTKNDVNTVHIINENGVGKLGKSIMPFSIDMNEILQETPIEDMSNIPLFLRNCKRKLHYHYFRMKQYQDFEAFLSGLKNCELSTDLGYTQIILKLIGVLEIESGRNYDIILYFYYESDDVRPRIVKIDSLTDAQLSDEKVTKFKKFFKYFKQFQLKVAFETALNTTHTVFLWTIESVENDFIEISDNDSNFVTPKRKRQNQSKKSRKKRQRVNETNTSNLHSSQESQQEESNSDTENISQKNSARDNKSNTKNIRTVKSKKNGTIKRIHRQDLMESENDSKELFSIQEENRKTKTIPKGVESNSNILKKKSKGADPKQRTLNFGSLLEKSDNNNDKIKNMTAMRKSIKWADEISGKGKEIESKSITNNIKQDAAILTSTPIRKKKFKKNKLIVPAGQELSVINKVSDIFPVSNESESRNEQNITADQVTKNSRTMKDSNDSSDTNSETSHETDMYDKELLNELQLITGKDRTAVTKKQKAKSTLPVKKERKNIEK
ncbi:uncharacterized protein LOC107264346 [Cephus cinctus]|uniref:Uncharacterized protein LOC107264346 n=1 Tax=Cephus cinctus TaxID=211228 RepID=A0AAJ7BK43_CEPCN|nr:uncharacterized protein LOC107264346 [Cephus cinctus]XP_015587991.1 uncharacterized protein LOC107264346 [Cephus cinctus]XP_015587992.1 uncharacterized protein LOC107264346 [Cephus cinctus]XP_015587993.1 uncharacterized protein LOC107264346 [Cephus cinctus]XP_015587994.1 uncharacterized protein LOC107264346 [Cephus cinctus]XP_015587995.1 uncharacterized protein LOC107264346 [Cephus cinctus]XP_015587996.1 uncharacterized protein LOC107264346 [Cephus cinctus]XP_024936976.1 uncharacterized p